MTTQIDKTMQFLGWPISKLRAALKSYRAAKTGMDEFGYLSGVKLTSGAAAALLGEAYVRGLIGIVDEEGNPSDDGCFGLTRAGSAVAAATARNRTKKESARLVLDRVLNKAESLSSDETTPIKVSKIWVFGSYIDPRRPDVGDLDVVIESRFTNVAGTADFQTRLAYIRKKYPNLLPSGFRPILGDMDSYFVDRYIYGARRPGLIAPNDLHTLCSLGCPCSLYFDIDRGGIIEPEFHQRHPNSPGRANHILDKLSMPDFPPMREYVFTPAVVATSAFVGHDKHPRIDSVASTNGTTVEESFLLVSHRWFAPLKFKRSLTFGESEWTYQADLDMPNGMAKGGKKIGELYGPNIRNALDLMQADILRLAAFRHEQGAMVSIIADVELSTSVKSWEGDYDRWHRRYILEDHESLQLDAFPDLYSWGVDFMVDDEGTGYVGPDQLEEGETWGEFGFPFSEKSYQEWKSRVEAATSPGAARSPKP